MEILEILDREEVSHEFRSDHDWRYISTALDKHKYCFAVSLDVGIFRRLLLNSSPADLHPAFERFPTLEEVVQQIEQAPDFLEQNPEERVLNGKVIKEILDSFKQGSELKVPFIRDKEPDMRESGTFYIADGMHSLTAYGIWTAFSPEKFPIKAFLCTDTSQ